MEEPIKIDVPSDVIRIIRTVEAAGYEAYAVGGCVRDALLGRTAHDWDVTTSAKPEIIKSLFEHTVDTGIKHGTVTVLQGKTGYEVTTYRLDGIYLDGRHPEKVEYTSLLSEDLKRRDFTINAMAYHPQKGLVDLFDGRKDLENRVIRCVGNPIERFTEDALRMMRAVRFSAQLDFSVEEKTQAAIKMLCANIRKVSHERIADELIKTITSEHPERFLNMYELGLTRYIMPEFDRMVACTQNNRYHCYTVGIHTIKVLENVPADKVLRLAALLHDVGKLTTKTVENGTDHFFGHCIESVRIGRGILKNLKLDNDTINKVCILIRHHDPEFPPTENGVRRLMHEVTPALMPALIALMRADVEGKSSAARLTAGNIDLYEKLYKEIEERGDCIYIKDLAVSGSDLINVGVKKGEDIGKCLNNLLEIVMDEPEKNKKETLLNIVKNEYL